MLMLRRLKAFPSRQLVQGLFRRLSGPRGPALHAVGRDDNAAGGAAENKRVHRIFVKKFGGREPWDLSGDQLEALSQSVEGQVWLQHRERARKRKNYKKPALKEEPLARDNAPSLERTEDVGALPAGSAAGTAYALHPSGRLRAAGGGAEEARFAPLLSRQDNQAKLKDTRAEVEKKREMRFQQMYAAEDRIGSSSGTQHNAAEWKGEAVGKERKPHGKEGLSYRVCEHLDERLGEHWSQQLESLGTVDWIRWCEKQGRGVKRSLAWKVKELSDRAMDEEALPADLAFLVEDIEGFSRAMAVSLLLSHLERAMPKLQEDPWGELMKCPGFNYTVAARVAIHLRCNMQLQSRGAAALLQVMNERTNNGHTWSSWRSVQQGKPGAEALLAMEIWHKDGLGWRKQPQPPFGHVLSTCLPLVRTMRQKTAPAIVVEMVRAQAGPGSSRRELVDLHKLPSSPSSLPGYAQCYLRHVHAAELNVARACTQGFQSERGTGAAGTGYDDSDAVEMSRSSSWGEEDEDDPGASTLLPESMALSDQQREAVAMVWDPGAGHVQLLTGAAGCGKTYATRAILLDAQSRGKKVKLCAPTGRAAQRLTQLTGAPASTVHRMLGVQLFSMWGDDDLFDEGRGDNSAFDDETRLPRYRYNKDNQLDADLVIVDEASMLDVLMASRLVSAMRPGARLLLVGDHNQLPPISMGDVFDEAIKANTLKQVNLTEIFRQAAGSQIISGAHSILKGKIPHPDMPCLTVKQLRDILEPATIAGALDGFQSEAGEEDSQLRRITALLGRSLGTSERVDAVVVDMDECDEIKMRGEVVRLVELFKEAGLMVHEDLQVISPFNKDIDSKTGTELYLGAPKLGNLLRPIMNPNYDAKDATGGGLGGLSVGDRVVQGRNDYDKDVYNGDQGLIVDVKEKSEGGDAQQQGKEGRKTKLRTEYTVHFAPRPHAPEKPHEVQYEVPAGSTARGPSDLNQAWCITVHKAQGGEFPILIVPMHERCPGRLKQRKLLYTACTRARGLLILMATRRALQQAVSELPDPRKNSLKDRLLEAAAQK